MHIEPQPLHWPPTRYPWFDPYREWRQPPPHPHPGLPDWAQPPVIHVASTPTYRS